MLLLVDILVGKLNFTLLGLVGEREVGICTSAALSHFRSTSATS